MNEPDARCCPHMELNDGRCTSRFALGEIEQLFSYCCGGYHACAMFHRINMERRFRDLVGDNGRGVLQPNRVPAMMTQATHDGRPLRSIPKAP